MSPRTITHQGHTRTISEWATLTGISYYTILNRLNNGWTEAAAIETTPRSRNCRCDLGRRQVHGLTKNKEWRAWQAMRARCQNPLYPCAHRYSGRGITVCDEWDQSFLAFYGHIGPAPSPGHSVDRINNDVGYEPDNVRWATAKEQARNRGSSHPGPNGFSSH